MAYITHTLAAAPAGVAAHSFTRRPALVARVLARQRQLEEAKAQQLRLEAAAARMREPQLYITQPDGTVIPKNQWTPEGFDNYHY